MRYPILLALTLVLACSSAETGVTPPPAPPPPPGGIAPAVLAVQAGDGQTAAAGATVAVAPSVVATDQAGQPVAGVTVAFAIDSGGGTVANATATSGANGVASSGSWTLGLGRNVLKATVAGLPPVRFGATGTGEVTVLDGSISSGGGVLTVSHAGDPLNGMQITVPANAFASAVQLKVHYGDQSGAPQRVGLRLVTPVMTIESNAAGYTSGAPLSFRIPATFASNEWPIALLFNRQTGAIEALPTVPIGTTAVVAMTRHINGDLLLPAAPGASISMNKFLRVGPVIQLVIGVVSYAKLAGDFDTGYRPNVDDWEFDHAFVLAPGNKSYNPGIPLAAAWYFSNFKSHGALNKQYQKAAGVEWSNPRGYKISAVMSTSLDWNALNAYNASLEVLATPFGITLDSLIYLSVKAGMYSTGRPQIIYANDMAADQTVASLLVYRTHGNVLDVTLGTSAAGIDAPRSLTLAQQHFAPLAWKTKDPDTGGIITTMLAHYGTTGATAGISFANVDQAWQQFFAGTIGDGIFPKVELVSRDYRPVKDTLFIPDDTTRVWLECPTCTGGFPLTTTAFQPQGNIAGGILYFADASGNWTGGTSAVKGNGIGAGDPENLNHYGFEVIGFEPGKGAYYLDWIDFVIKTKRLKVLPNPLKGGANTDYDLTATYDRPMPANPSWVWNLGDGRTVTTSTGKVTINYPIDLAHPVRMLDIKVSLKSGATLEATGHAAAEIKNCADDFTDARDGVKYKIVCIGTQTWMAENLRFATGDSRCYDDNPANCVTYGRMYSWTTMLNGAAASTTNPSHVRGICAVGWHVPSIAEWIQLRNLFGTVNTAGPALKSTTLWRQPDNGTNASGFGVVPGGVLDPVANIFKVLGDDAYLWGSDQFLTGPGFLLGSIITARRNATYFFDNGAGAEQMMSVRCLKD